MSTHGDLIDRANDMAQKSTDDIIGAMRRRQALRAERPSAVECEGCAALIPQARREAIPGVSTCIDCATAAEYQNRCGVRP